MKNSLFKSITAICAAFLLLFALAPAAYAADSDIAVPDTNSALFAALEAAGKAHANASYYTVGELKSWTGILNLSNKGITSIAGLENCAGITELNLSENSGLASITPLDGAAMTSLFNLNLSNTDITALPNHLQMPALHILNLASTHITTAVLMTAVALPNITALNITNCGISDLTALAQKPSITSLHIGYNQVSDLTPLAGMNLDTLSIDGNLISDLTPLAGMNLNWLTAANNFISDLTPLSGMTNLAGLYVAQNYLDPTDGSADRAVLDMIKARPGSLVNYDPQFKFTVHFDATPYTNPADIGPIYYGAPVTLPATVAGMPGDKQLLGWDTDNSGSQDHAGGSTVTLAWPVIPIPSNEVTYKAYFTTPPPLSADSTLTGLAASQPMTPAFDPATLSYSVSLPGSADHVILAVTPAAGATCTIDGMAGTNRGIAVNPGETKTVSIAVTAQNGINTTTYTVTVTRAKLDAACKLTGLSLTPSSAALSPAFSAGVTAYTVTLPANTGSVTITPAKPEKATMKIDGAAVSSVTVSVGEGQSKAVAVEVTAENGEEKTAYQITVTRPDASELLSLGCSAGTLSPAFNADVKSYTLTLPEDVGSVTLAPMASSPSAKLYVHRRLAADHTYTLKKTGSSVKTMVRVVSATGASTTYNVVITRSPSTDATLKSLTAGYSLSPAFSPNVYAYAVSVPANKGAVKVKADKASKEATVTINGRRATAMTIKVGRGQSVTVTIVVTAQAGNTKTYVVTLTRP